MYGEEKVVSYSGMESEDVTFLLWGGEIKSFMSR